MQTGLGNFIEGASHVPVFACCVVAGLSLLRSVWGVTSDAILGGDKAVYAMHASVEFKLS